MNSYKILFFLILILPLIGAGQSNIIISKLNCQYRNNPLGIDESQPVLSWKLESNDQGQKQKAYQVLVASTPEKLTESESDLWNTGKVNSAQSVAVKYSGKTLQSRQKVYWKVKIWDADRKSVV